MLLEVLLKSLAPGCASLTISDREQNDDLIVEILPKNQEAARIRARVTRELVVLCFGRGAVFEIPEEGRYTGTAYLEEVRLLCSGVIAGKFEEIVTMVGSEVVGARAKVTLDTDDVASGVWRRMTLRLFRKTENVHLTYAPYCATSQKRLER